jgi:hypothetical protein
MLCVDFYIVILSVIMLGVVLLSVAIMTIIQCHFAGCQYAEYYFNVSLGCSVFILGLL